MWLQIALTLLVVISCTYALTAQEAAQFTTAGGCEPSGEATGAELTVNYNNGVTTIQANHVPNHPWEVVNPNSPVPVSENYTFRSPSILQDNAVYCLPLGPIGIAKNGVFIFNPTAAGGENAKEAETMDSFGGHTAPFGEYHYHYLPDNGLVWNSSNPNSQFIGVAFDGNPIYSIGRGIDIADLDICHGVTVNGRYRYIASADHYPYFLGCFRGTLQQNLPRSSAICQGMANYKACTCEFGTLSSNKKKRGLLDILSDILREEEREQLNSKRATQYCGSTSSGNNGGNRPPFGPPNGGCPQNGDGSFPQNGGGGLPQNGGGGSPQNGGGGYPQNGGGGYPQNSGGGYPQNGFGGFFPQNGGGGFPQQNSWYGGWGRRPPFFNSGIFGNPYGGRHRPPWHGWRG